MNQIVIAIIEQEKEYKAAVLSRRGTGCEIHYTRSAGAAGLSMGDFCRQVASAVPLPDIQKGRRIHYVFGYESRRTAFYSLRVPDVAAEELDALIRLQAEDLLPLPADQMTLTWRAGRSQNGKLPVTLAASRTESLITFFHPLEEWNPDKIVLESEAVVKACHAFHPGLEQEYLLVCPARQHIQIYQVQHHLVTGVLTVDRIAEPVPSADRPSETPLESFRQTLYSALKTFGLQNQKECPVYILPQNGWPSPEVITELARPGLNVKRLSFSAEHLHYCKGAESLDVSHWLAPLGLALIALDPNAGTLNLFETILPSAARRKRSRSRLKLKYGLTAALLLAIALPLIMYGLDLARLKKMEAALARSEVKTNLAQREREENLKNAIARQRPDILSLLRILTDSAPEGILLDSFHTKKGQPVRLQGSFQDKNKLFDFAEKLQQQKGIQKVRILSQSRDDKKKQSIFTLTLEYQHFSSLRKTGSPGLQTELLQ